MNNVNATSEFECPICTNTIPTKNRHVLHVKEILIGEQKDIIKKIPHIICEECWNHWLEQQLLQQGHITCPFCREVVVLNAPIQNPNVPFQNPGIAVEVPRHERIQRALHFAQLPDNDPERISFISLSLSASSGDLNAINQRQQHAPLSRDERDEAIMNAARSGHLNVVNRILEIGDISTFGLNWARQDAEMFGQQAMIQRLNQVQVALPPAPAMAAM